MMSSQLLLSSKMSVYSFPSLSPPSLSPSLLPLSPKSDKDHFGDCVVQIGCQEDRHRHCVTNTDRHTQTHTQTHTLVFDSRVVEEGVFVDGVDDRLEGDLGGECVSMLNHRLSIRPIPAVHYTHTVHTQTQTQLYNHTHTQKVTDDFQK